MILEPSVKPSPFLPLVLIAGLAAGLPAVEAIAKDGVVRGSVKQPSLDPAAVITDEVPLPPLGPILAQARSNPLIYGLYAWDGEYLRLRQQIREVGWRFIRLGGPIGEGIVSALKEDKVQVMYTFCIRQKQDPDHAGDQAFVDDYVRRLADLVKRHDLKKPQFLVECWNEPNFGYLIQPDKRPQSQQERDRYILYAKLLVATRRALQGSGLPLVGFGAGGSGAGDGRFIKAVHDLDPAVAASYDIASTHPYVDPSPPELYKRESWGRYAIATNVASIRQTLASNGRQDTPVWFTEVGWEVSQAEGGRYAGRQGAIPSILHAAYTCRLYAYAQRLGVERVSNMFAMDSDGYNGGFFGQDCSWRPVAHAVKAMIGLMPEPKLVAVPSDGRDGLFIYRFQATAAATSRQVLMAWNVLGPRTVELPLPVKSVAVVDMLGKTQEARLRGGVLLLETGPLPMYVILDSQAQRPVQGSDQPQEVAPAKPRTPNKVDPQLRDRYATMLRERALAAARDGKGPVFHLSTMQALAAVCSGDDDEVELQVGATTMQVAWKTLGNEDRASLAAAIARSGAAGDAALAAFWLRCAGRDAEALVMIGRAGDLAAEVQAAFQP